MEVYNAAIMAKEYPPAVAAITGVAKLHGLVVDRAQIEAVIRKPSFDPNADATVSETEWLEQFGSKIAIDYQAEPQPPTEPVRSTVRDNGDGSGKIIDMFADD